MSEEQLSALLAKLKEDAGLQEKFKSVADLDALVSMAKEAGFDVSKADWLKFQAQQTLELSDEELESVSGGFLPAVPLIVWPFIVGAAAAVTLNQAVTDYSER